MRKRSADDEAVTRRDRVVVNELNPAPRNSLASTRLRPLWHKVVGLLIIVSAVAVVIVNELELTLLPGAHTEAYLFLAAAVTGYGMWWLGWFDDGRPSRPTDRDTVRQRL